MSARAPEPPTSGPTQEDIENAEAWERLATSSAESVVNSAEKWRNGLAALVTLITGGLIIAGPDGSDMPAAWRIAATIITTAGIGCAAVGCFLALSVSAGRPSIADLPSIVAKYHSVQNYSAIQATKKVKQVAAVQVLAIIAVAALVLGAAAWSMAPKAQTQPDTPKFSVDSGKNTYCGDLVSADKGVIVLAVKGEKDHRVLPYTSVTNFRQTEKC
jgi:hypothetical protein